MNPPDSELMTYVIRMVIPLRREFGRVLDVNSFLRNQSYAVEVIDEALTSHDERLQNYAIYVQGKLFGPRTAVKLGSNTGQPAKGVHSLIQEATPSVEALKMRDSNDNEGDIAKAQKELQAKYKMGLR